MSILDPMILGLLFGILIALTASLIFFYFIAPRIDGFRRFRGLGKVFASYSHHDKPAVEKVSQLVKALGGEFVLDETHIRGGDEWREKIKQLISESDTFQLFWSQNASRSEEVKNEWEYALGLNRRGFIKPIYWDKTVTWPSELGDFQFTFVDFASDSRAAVQVPVKPGIAVIRNIPVSILAISLLTIIALSATTFWGVQRAAEMLSTAPKEPKQIPQLRSTPTSEPISTPTPTSTPISSHTSTPTRLVAPKLLANATQGTTLDISSIGSSLPPVLGPSAVITVSEQTGTDYDAYVGFPSERSRLVTVRNTGSIPLEVEETRIVGPNGDDFIISTNKCTSTPLAPNVFCNLVIRFKPYGGGLRKATLSVAIKPIVQPLTVVLAGKGIPNAVTSSYKSLDFGSLKVNGGPKLLTVEVHADGRANFGFQSNDVKNLISIMSAGKNMFDDIDLSFSILKARCTSKPNPEDQIATCNDLSVTMSFSPQSEGKHVGSLYIHILNSGYFILPLKGSGVK